MVSLPSFVVNHPYLSIKIVVGITMLVIVLLSGTAMAAYEAKNFEH